MADEELLEATPQFRFQDTVQEEAVRQARKQKASTVQAAKEAKDAAAAKKAELKKEVAELKKAEASSRKRARDANELPCTPADKAAAGAKRTRRADKDQESPHDKLASKAL